MKKIIMLCVMVSAIASTIRAGDEPGTNQFTEEKLNSIERNMVLTLESSIPGIQASAAQTVRDLKRLAPDYSFSRLVIPLMRILKDSNGETGPKILAALALHELGSEMGDFTIRRVAQFSEVPQLKRLCTWMVYERMVEQGRIVAREDFANKGSR